MDIIFYLILKKMNCCYSHEASFPFCVARLVAELLRDPVRELPELDAVTTFLPSKFTCEWELFPFTAFLIWPEQDGTNKKRRD